MGEIKDHVLTKLRQHMQNEQLKESARLARDEYMALSEYEPFEIHLMTNEILEDCRLVMSHKYAIQVDSGLGRLFIPKHSILYVLLEER